MRFTSLRMTDFRGTRELEVDFEPDMTIIVGRNGAGKTSILDALNMMIRFAYLHQAPDINVGLSNIYDIRDIRENAHYTNINLCLELKSMYNDSQCGYPLELVFGRDGISPDLVLPGQLSEWPTGMEFMPRFIHYRQDRGFNLGRTARPGDGNPDVLDPKAVQVQSLKKDTNAIGDLGEWWDLRDAQEARLVRDVDRNHRDPQLDAIRNLIARIDSFSSVAFSSTDSPPGLYFVKNDGASVHVDSLSGGERSYIILLADLARRLQVFAPDTPLEEIPAIVLIDEIELNLHPAWQSEIAPTLLKVFRSCQFIVTTHSPQVLSGVESRNVRLLRQEESGPTTVSTPLSTRGRTSNYLLEGVFGAAERFPPIERLIEDFNSAIDKGDGTAAAETLARIEQEVEGDAVTLLVLRKRLKKLRNVA